MKEYEWIKKWGYWMNSFTGYIRDQIELARQDNAPDNAIYKQDDGTWATTDDITSEVTRESLKLPPLPAPRRAALRRGQAKSLRDQAAALEAEAEALLAQPGELVAKGDLRTPIDQMTCAQNIPARIFEAARVLYFACPEKGLDYLAGRMASFYGYTDKAARHVFVQAIESHMRSQGASY